MKTISVYIFHETNWCKFIYWWLKWRLSNRKLSISFNLRGCCYEILRLHCISKKIEPRVNAHAELRHFPTLVNKSKDGGISTSQAGPRRVQSPSSPQGATTGFKEGREATETKESLARSLIWILNPASKQGFPRQLAVLRWTSPLLLLRYEGRGRRRKEEMWQIEGMEKKS